MWFASPLWLIGLLPWGALAIWLVWGRSAEAAVPFLELWTGSKISRPTNRRLHLPPIGILAVLFAMLLALLGAAAPRFTTSNGSGHFTIIVDRGASMSAKGQLRERFKELAVELSRQLEPRIGSVSPATLTLVPGRSHASDTTLWLSAVEQEEPTAIDTSTSIPAAVASALSYTAGPVLVITDRQLPLYDPRLIQIAPTQPIKDIAIAAIGLSQDAGNQLMVTIANNSDQKTAHLQVRTGDQSLRRDVPLPARGEKTSVFLDLPQLGSTLTAELADADDFAGNNIAYLVHEIGWPKIETRTALPPELSRVIEIYQARRPSSESSKRLFIVNDPSSLHDNEPGIVLSSHNLKRIAGTVQATVHPLTESIQFTGLTDIEIADNPPTTWQPIVTIAGKPMVAVAPTDPRRVWIGFDSVQFTLRPSFVVFWAKLFDWIGAAGDNAFAYHRVGQLGPDWQPLSTADSAAARTESLWPGVYRNASGKLAAVNALGIVQPQVTSTDWKTQLAHWQTHNAGFALAPALLFAALMLVLVAAAFW